MKNNWSSEEVFELLESLRQMADGEHDDLSIAADAADLIEQLIDVVVFGETKAVVDRFGFVEHEEDEIVLQ